MLMCMCARVGRLYFLSIYDDDEDDVENACIIVAGLFRLEQFSFLGPSLSLFFLMSRTVSLGIIEQRKKVGGYRIDINDWMNVNCK
jgi:hypothetical protein